NDAVTSVARSQRERSDRPEVSTGERGRGPQDHTLRTGNRIERPVIESVDPWHDRPIVEAHHELGTKIHPPRPADHDPHEIRAVRREHEVDNGRTTRVGLEFGFEDAGAGTIAAACTAGRILWSEPAA